MNQQQIEPRSGVAFTLNKGDLLTVIDPEGEQVADLVAYSQTDIREVISSGRTLDYASKLFLSTDDLLYSNRSNVMLKIVHDDVGRHDFLLTPCSKDTFRIIYGDTNPHQGCFGNLAHALKPFGIEPDDIPVAFNCFMHVAIDGNTGAISVQPPLSRPGERIVFKAEMDLIIGLTACSALQSNNGSFKPISYLVSSVEEQLAMPGI